VLLVDYLIKKQVVKNETEFRRFVLMGKVSVNRKIITFDENTINLRKGDIVSLWTRHFVVTGKDVDIV